MKCLRRERGEEHRAQPRPGPAVRSTLRVAAAAWTGFARCYVAVADGGEAVHLPSDRRGRFTPSATSRMCYQRNATPRLDRQYLIPDSDDRSATSGSIRILFTSALTMVESLFAPNHRISARTPTWPTYPRAPAPMFPPNRDTLRLIVVWMKLVSTASRSPLMLMAPIPPETYGLQLPIGYP